MARIARNQTDSHGHQDYSDPVHPARMNLELILKTIPDACRRMGMRPEGITLDVLCKFVLESAL